MQGPDRRGYFGAFGGRYVPETLMGPLEELARSYRRSARRRSFRKRLDELLHHYAGRPTPLHFAERLSEHFGGARIYLKREDLLHTGSHQLNSALGQALLAQRMGKERLVTETGSGQNGVATAAAAALLGLDCCVYMGVEDMRRQRLDVERIELHGARVMPVDTGRGGLDEAIAEALRDWVTNLRHSHYVAASVLGPDPYPRMVADFQQVVGREAARQLRRGTRRSWPDLAIAAVGGGGHAIGLFGPFVSDSRVRLVGVEAGGVGPGPGENAARLRAGSPGILYGARTLVLQDEDGQVVPTHSIAADLNHPAIGPQHAALAERGRVEYTTATDAEAVAAFELLARTEGILPALESAHALVEVGKHAPELAASKVILVCISGRGDKDVEPVLAWDRSHSMAGEAERVASDAARDWSDDPEETAEREIVEAPPGSEAG